MNALIAAYRQRLNLPHATFIRIDHDDAMVALVYKVIQPTGEPRILKVCSRPKDYLREVYFLNYFAYTSLVPRVIQTVEPEGDIPGAILMQCLPGALLKTADLTESLCFEIGALLAQIHRNPTSGYGDLLSPETLSPDPRSYFTLKFEEGMEECASHLPQALLDQCRSYYEAYLPLLSAADGPCIIHRDFRLGNIMVDQGKLQGILDWSSARASFAQEDFYPMEQWESPIHPETKKSFLAGYASVRPLPDYREMLPFLGLSRAIAIIGFMVKRGTWHGPHTGVYQSNRRFLERLFQQALS